MCVYSMIADHYRQKWEPLVQPLIFPQYPPVAPAISPEEVAELRELLRKAREYDKRHSEPECELEEKKVALKKIAEALGVNVSFIDEDK